MSSTILTKHDLPEQIVEKYSDIKCNENTSSGSRVVPCGQKERHVTFRNFTNQPDK
jgi:hypothetical protein